MSHLPLNNVPAFFYAAWRLAQAGYIPVLPPGAFWGADKKPGSSDLYRRVIPGDIAGLAECDVIIALPGSSNSRGFLLETHAAELFDIPMFRGKLSSQPSLSLWMDDVIKRLNAWKESRIADSRLLESVSQEAKS